MTRTYSTKPDCVRRQRESRQRIGRFSPRGNGAPARRSPAGRLRRHSASLMDRIPQIVLHLHGGSVRAAGALISLLLAAVMLTATYEQHKASLADNSELVQTSTARIANGDGGEVLHAFKTSREKEHREQIEAAVGLASLIAGIALVASLTMTRKCRFCGKRINAAVTVCRFCGEDPAARNL
jgi:hypothetical protein